MRLSTSLTRRHFASLASCAAVAHWFDISNAETVDTWQQTPHIWSDGQLLAFSGIDGPTNYDLGLVARSTKSPCGLSIVLPGRTQLTFGSRETDSAHLTSDTFRVSTENGVTTGVFADASHLLVEGYCDTGDLPANLECQRKGRRTLIGAKALYDASLLDADLGRLIAARHEWLLRHRVAAALPAARRQTLAKVLCVMKGQINSPEGMIRHRWTTPDRWPHRDLWLWDSVFHALGWRHLDMTMARETLEAVFDGQQPDGRIPHQLSPKKCSAITQPPLLAFGVEQLAGKPVDMDWIRRCYPRLRRYLDWDFEHRVGDDKLAHWFIDPDPLSRSGESGMDNSPRFDGATRLYAVDFNAFLSMECAIMADFAAILQLPNDVAEWRRKHEGLNRRIDALLWNEEAGFYFDYDPVARAQTNVMAVSGFLPLLCGAANEAKVQRLLAQMDNPKTFGTTVSLPSAVVSEGLANPGDMWRGPMWVNTNWLVAYGLDRVGRRTEASRLREKTMVEIERRYLELGSLFEFYDESGVIAPDKLPRKGRNDPTSPYHQAIHDYGWTSTLYADLVYSQR